MGEQIEHRFDEDEFFGYDWDDRVGTDIEASKLRYIELVTARLAEDYPDAELDIREAYEGEVGSVKVWGFDDREEFRLVAESIDQVYESQGWVVDESPSTFPGTLDMMDSAGHDACVMSLRQWVAR